MNAADNNKHTNSGKFYYTYLNFIWLLSVYTLKL